MAGRRRFGVEPLEGRVLLAAATVNWNDVRQNIDGFGASSAWMWGTISSTALNQLYSTSSGAGLSLLRSRIAPNGSSSEASIMQQVGSYGVRVWSTPWTPPREWKTNHDTANGGALDPAHYQDYANDLADYIEDEARQGVQLYAVSLQNEPNWVADYESCIWTADQFAAFLPYVGQTFASRGITTKIMLPETLNWSGISSLASTVMANPALAQYVGILAGHNYGETSGSYQPVSIANGKPVWETEVYSTIANGSELATAIDTADDIHQAMSDANASAYHYWWINSSGSSELMNNWVATKRLWAMGQYSRFVRPGWVRIGETDDGGLDITTFKDPVSGKFAIVVVNTSTSAVTESFTLSGFAAGTVTPYITSSTDNLTKYSDITLTGGTSFSATIAGSSIVTYYGTSSSAAALQAPTRVMAVPVQGASTSSIALTWTDNSSSETSYTVERSIDGTNWTVLSSTLAANTTSYTDSGRAENTRYYYRVKPTNGDATTYSSVVSGATVLQAQNWWSISGTRTSTGVNLSWTIASSVSTGVSIDRSLDGLTWTNIAKLTTRATSYSDTIPGYSASQIYYYRIRNTASSTSSAYTSSAYTGWNTGLSTPANFVASQVTTSSITFTWTSPTVGATGASIEQYNTATNSWSTVSPSSLLATAGVWTLTGLSSNTSYTFRMRVSSDADSVYSSYTSSLSVTTPFQTVWYKANESSGTVLNDAYSSAHNATLSGSYSFTPGASGNALTLSGGYATMPTGIVSGLNDFTISVWINVSSLDTWARVFDLGTSTSNYMFLTAKANSGLPRFAINTGSGEQTINSSIAIAANTWTHIAVTLSGNSATLYINGVVAGTNTNMTIHPAALGSTTQNYLGDSQFSADPTFKGAIDDFRIYGRSLAASEIQGLAAVNAQLAWYKADQTSGAVLADASGSGNDASLIGSYSFGTGLYGNAVTLSGGYATLPAGIVGGLNDFTIATWVKATSIDTWARIFDFGTSTSNYMFLTAKANSGLPRFAINTGSGEQTINSSLAIAANTWTHIAVTLSGNSATLYINGVVAGTNTSMTIHPAALGATTQNYLGDSQYSADPTFKGSVDDFRVYRRALSSPEIQGLYNNVGLPSGWASSDVGVPAIVGSTSYNPSTATWTLNGSGADIGGTSDQFQYSYELASGDFAIIARVVGMTSTNSPAKAGIMMRDGVGASAAFALMAVVPGGQALFEYRATSGGTVQVSAQVGGTGVKYLKLERTAGMVTGYYSSDGITWTAAANAAYVYMPNSITAGLAVCAHDNTKICTATIDKVQAISAATVTNVSINAGNAQRSRVTSVSITFSSPVTLAGDAVTAVRRSDGATFTTTVAGSSSDGLTYTLSFSGSGLEWGSLPDGLYDLTVRGAYVHDALGQAVTGGSYVYMVHRLFGDSNGDRAVDATDQTQFQAAQATYNAAFDFNGDGKIDSTDQAAFAARVGTSLGAPSLPATYSWTSSGVLMSAPADSTHTGISIKDPTTVYYNGKWYVFASWVNTSGAYNMVYYSFSDWSQAATAQPFFMDSVSGFAGYRCAPEVFFMRPLNKWVLIFQGGDPMYSFLDDINHPELATSPKPFFPQFPATASNWIDFNIICDDTYAYLFFTKDNGEFYRSRTRLSDFPNGFTEPTLVMSTSSANLFEAGHIYKLAGMDKYIAIIEAHDSSWRRYYTAYIADRLDGTWTGLGTTTSTYANLLASLANVTSGGWSNDISHGELIRSGYDETMTVDPARLQLLYQGLDSSKVTSGTSYGMLPWQLGVLTIVNPAPTIVTAAAASPAVVTGTTTKLSVLGGDDGGEANLVYTWSVTSKPSGAVDPVFSINGTNAAKTTTATFSQYGNYGFLVTVTDAGGISATSSVSVSVNQTPTTVVVMPASAIIAQGATGQFAATVYDQFGAVAASQPTFSWSASGGGTIDTSGLFTASDLCGSYQVSATAVGLSGSAQITVADVTAPTLGSASSRKVHGAAGTFDLPLSLTGSTIEPRLGGASTLILNFSEPVVAVDGVLSANEFALTNATFASASVSGSRLILSLTNVADQKWLTLSLAGLSDLAGNLLTGDIDLEVGNLYGDVNQSGSVSVADQQSVKNQLLGSVTASSFLLDLNLSGTISVADQQMVKNNLLHRLP